jgi:hypothetical protein
MVNVSREWATYTDLNWDRQDMLTHGRGRPRANGNVFCIRKRGFPPLSIVLFRDDPILGCHVEDLSPASMYLVKYLNYGQNGARVYANSFKELFVNLLWVVMSPSEGLPTIAIYQNFKNDFEDS